ncbi:ATP-dependent nuclease [Desertibaculum subflavum]|uniref:ATP-dependent nuclease n=1 Tax=Desertibaculum subflavum TaxID=2268458 RepID=UPI0013C4FA1D
MLIKSIGIKNFRSNRNVSIEFGRLTRIIGANGVGKSTILKALELFYAPGNINITRDDFFDISESDEIEVAITFTEFSDGERENFGSRIAANGTMTVTRIFSLSGGRSNGRYFGMTLRNPEFTEIRSRTGREKTGAYNDLVASGRYDGLARVTRIDQVEPALAAWEATNPTRCELGRDDGQFFGFVNVGQGKLTDATRFVYVPAVRDATDDVADRNSAIATLLDLVVRSAIEARPEVRQFRATVEADFQRLMDPGNLTELGGLATGLTSALRAFYAEAAVLLNWRDIPPLNIPLPAAEIRLDDDGIQTPVDRTGHGLQRALILTLLQYLAMATERSPDRTSQGADAAPTEEVPTMIPGLILAIEEPELYQHPTKQRHFARVLERLSAGQLPGVAAKTQVVFTTHSPLFVSLDKFEEICLIRRWRPDPERPREALSSRSSLGAIAGRLAQANSIAPGLWTRETLLPRLHVIDVSVAEGFFASVACLVEGPSDRAALLAAASMKDVDLEAHEIAVIVVDGKGNLDKPLEIFRSLGIKTFTVWDCDGARQPAGLRQNQALQRLEGVGVADIADHCSRITSSYACFDVNLETTVKAEIDAELWDRHLDALKTEFGVASRDDAQKVPAIMRELLARCANEGGTSATLSTIIDALLALRQELAPAEPQ